MHLNAVWDPATYDSERRRLIPCFEGLYGAAAELVARFCPPAPHILDLGAGTGILSAALAERVPAARLTLLDASPAMLERAALRLAQQQPALLVQSLDAALPTGPFDAVVSALAIHHLEDAAKRDLYRRILAVLAPGGLFLNAEQVAGGSPRLQALFEAVHLEQARALGSSEAEIAAAVQRMAYDRCATAEDQVAWLAALGFEDAACFFRAFRFALFAAWKPAGA